MSRPDPHAPIHCETHGGGADTLVLIHGLGAHGAVWDGLIEQAAAGWNGRIVVPDLRGHGRSAHRGIYSFGTFAADIADLLDPGGRIAIIGHSLGGALAALLGSGWFGVTVDMVLALSVKTDWRAEELAKFRDLSRQPVKWMDDRDSAEERFLRASGLAGLAVPGGRIARHGVAEENGRFRFAADPAVIGSTGPHVDVLLRAAACPLHFATGAADRMAPAEQMRPYDPGTAVIEGAGHNLHVEAPVEVWALFTARWRDRA